MPMRATGAGGGASSVLPGLSGMSNPDDPLQTYEAFLAFLHKQLEAVSAGFGSSISSYLGRGQELHD